MVIYCTAFVLVGRGAGDRAMDRPCAVRGCLSQDCLRLAATGVDYSDQEASAKRRKTWLETCRQAYAANGDDPRIKVALARALQNRTESVPLLRAAAAQNDTEAMLALFNDFNSFDRLNRPDLIARVEAKKALRRAAELGDREAIWRLARQRDVFSVRQQRNGEEGRP